MSGSECTITSRMSLCPFDALDANSASYEAETILAFSFSLSSHLSLL